MQDWMMQLEEQERFEHEAVHVFCDLIELIGLEKAISKALAVLEIRRMEQRSRVTEDFSAVDFP